MMRILIRTSRWAIWARRLGSVAVPLVVTSVLLHRLRLISSEAFINAAVVAALAAGLAVLCAVIALARLWQTGDRGWGKALLGLFLGLICLAPFGWYGQLALSNPPVTDLATTMRGALPLVFEPDTAFMPPPRLLSPADMETFYPSAETRRYPVSQAQTFALIEQMIADAGWDVRRVQPPNAALDPALINAQSMSLPGWRDEVVVRVTGNETSAVVDMRSASLHAPHDFGANGARIESFLADLDTRVTTLLRDDPNINLPEAEPDEPVDPVAAETQAQ